MHRGRKVSSIELDIIDIYNYFPDKSIELIAKEVRVPMWMAERAVFKHLNGMVVNGYYISNGVNTGKYVSVRHSVNPTGASVTQARQQTETSNLKLRTR